MKPLPGYLAWPAALGIAVALWAGVIYALLELAR
jgi:hypothetical protein